MPPIPVPDGRDTAEVWWSWVAATRVAWPTVQASARHRRGLLLLGLAAFVLLRYVPLLGGGLTESVIPDEFAEAPAFYWSIVLLDLGLVVPITCVAAVAVLRGSSVAVPALYAVVGWFALAPPSVAAMAVVMVITGDPHASAATMTLLVVAAVAFGAVAWRLFVPLVRAWDQGEGRWAHGVGPLARGRWARPRSRVGP